MGQVAAVAARVAAVQHENLGAVHDFTAHDSAQRLRSTGPFFPFGIAISPDNKLFVSNTNTGNIGEYDVTTGAPINANFIIHLSNPTGLAIVYLASPTPTPTPKPKPTPKPSH